MSVAIYCDESCHLENDESTTMGLGAVWAVRGRVRHLGQQLRAIKLRHKASGELKWTKVSEARVDFYKEVVDWFFDSPDLHFRSLIVPNKGALDHSTFNQGSHDDFIYKMYFSMLNKILSPPEEHEIFIDIKDTRSNLKVKKLKDVLCYDKWDFTGELISNIQQVRSHEIELMQLADFLLGSVVYLHRGLQSSASKRNVAEYIQSRSGRSVLHSSPLSNTKFNVFVWRAR